MSSGQGRLTFLDHIFVVRELSKTKVSIVIEVKTIRLNRKLIIWHTNSTILYKWCEINIATLGR